MGIQLIQSKRAPRDKWIVWKRNIFDGYFCHLIGYHFSIGQCRDKKWVTYFAIDETNNPSREPLSSYSSPIRPDDLLRNFTLQEYLELSNALKFVGYVYNKKTDEFIKVK